jgi:histone H3/H4
METAKNFIKDAPTVIKELKPELTQKVQTGAHKKGRKSTNKTMAIPYACVKRLAQNRSGGMRISSDAVYVIEKALEDFAEKLVAVSKSYTGHRSRKTITSIDIEAALKNLSEM